MLHRISAHDYGAETSNCAPVKVIVKDLNLGILDLPTLFLRDRDENRGVRFANEEALLSFPLELMPGVDNTVCTSHLPKKTENLLFPLERPPERQGSSGLEFNYLRWVVELQDLYFARG